MKPARNGWVAAAILFFAAAGGEVAALEVDCAACGFCQGKKDLAGELNARVRQHLAAGRTVAQIAAREGGSLVWPRIQSWADAHPESAKPDARLVKYRGAKFPGQPLFNPYAHCIKVGGVCLGSDKLGHLFQQGWEYYLIAVLDGKGDALAERYGEWLEGREPREQYAADEEYFRRQPSGRLVGYGGYGRCISGIISHADLSASEAGLRMYRDLAAGRFENITNYVSEKFCEEVNLNDYTPEMKRIVAGNGRR